MSVSKNSLMKFGSTRISFFRYRVEELLALADIRINGDRPWDLHINNERFFARVMAHANLGLGESYMDGWWDCQSIDEFMNRILRAGIHNQIRNLGNITALIRAKLVNLQSPSRALQVGRHHYDIGNDLYRCMLDRRMIYSCAYWNGATNLDDAQEAKLDLISQKLQLKPGMKLLDIGCGWGGTAKYLVEKYDVEVTGITVSSQQVKMAQRICKGLPVKILFQDYRKLEGHFDRIMAIGMFEHVGIKNYRTYMTKISSLLSVDGLFLLHTIGRNSSVINVNPWMERYIFPNSMLPSATQITRAYEGLFILEDWHCFGSDYDPTLMAWKRNIDSSWDALQLNYNDRFRLMWTYYLLSNAGAFRARANQLWQILLSPKGVIGGLRVPH